MQSKISHQLDNAVRWYRAANMLKLSSVIKIEMFYGRQYWNSWKSCQHTDLEVEAIAMYYKPNIVNFGHFSSLELLLVVVLEKTCLVL